MQTLEMIDLSCNSLQRIAADFQWPNLAHLFLQNNKIVSLPPPVSRLTALRDLNVTQNALDFLPYELSVLGETIEPEHFERIIVYADGNPFLGLPPRTADVVQPWEFWGGERGMCQLLKSQAKSASAFSRVKVLVVGSGNVRKLLKRFFFRNRFAHVYNSAGRKVNAGSVLCFGGEEQESLVPLLEQEV